MINYKASLVPALLLAGFFDGEAQAYDVVVSGELDNDIVFSYDDQSDGQYRNLDFSQSEFFSLFERAFPSGIQSEDGKNIPLDFEGILQIYEDHPVYGRFVYHALEGGFQASRIEPLFTDILIPINACIENELYWDGIRVQLQRSSFSMYSRAEDYKGRFTIKSHKTFDCKDPEDPSVVKKFSLWRHWVIEVDDNLYHQPVSGGSTVYRIFAGGESIALKVYGELVQPYSATEPEVPILTEEDLSNMNRPNYYKTKKSTCLHVNFNERPENGISMGSSGGKVKFCASGCGPGGVDATQ